MRGTRETRSLPACRRSTTAGPSRKAARLAAQLAALEQMGRAALLEQWRQQFGRPAPARLGQTLLAGLLAYGLQEKMRGGLCAREHKALAGLVREGRHQNAAGRAQGCTAAGPEADALAGQDGRRSADQTGSGQTGSGQTRGSLSRCGQPRSSHPGPGQTVPARFQLAVGTQLVRDWHGVSHAVMVEEQGYDWQGRRYRSLSAIARAITGARWSGPRFFGLAAGKVGAGAREGPADQQRPASPAALQGPGALPPLPRAPAPDHQGVLLRAPVGEQAVSPPVITPAGIVRPRAALAMSAAPAPEGGSV